MDIPVDSSLISLANYLTARREAILNNWLTVCQAEPGFNTTRGLSREEFNNKVPFMLNVLDQRLRQVPLQGDIRLLAGEHGLHRWQKGYLLRELMGEIRHLNTILLAELRQFWQASPAPDAERVMSSYEYVSWFSAQSNQGSVEQYTELQRSDASSRVQLLEQALDDLNELTRQRGDLLRTASHDLRGSFGVIQGAASYLNLMEASESDRKEMLEMLNRNLTTVREMVIQLMDLSRLEAGQEPVTIQTFDASQHLNKLVDSYQPLAIERGLVLKADGPSDLQVQSDPLQLQRIVQNLVLNALKNTSSGWVSVSWAAEGDYRWLISIQDSGPGLPNQQVGSLSQVLAPSPESSSAFGLPNPEADAREEAITLASKQGEGIGLSIVKRLCELLGASLEIEAKAGQGTLFRIRMPINWKA
ncbi:sensor histidine kinase [Larkinella terrae]|uniref:histidine kinase n=1 Tax=Larkinella terrae TaxID=2025311 RepID=A0A7K0EE32_9BACT|nr:sensor histidine kinase [Larkinella terrae]MRS59708.1 sensor histidine kinase [Larkinella terrae]